MKTTLNRIPPLSQPCDRIDFDRLPSPAKLRQLNEYIKSGHNSLVRFFSQKGDWADLDWTKLVPALKRLQLQNYCRHCPLTSLEPLNALEELQELGIDGFVSKKLDILVLKRFKRTLRLLSVGAPNIDADSLFELVKQLRVKSLSMPRADFERLSGIALDFLGLGAGQAIHVESFAQLKKVTRLVLNGTQIPSLDMLLAHPKLKELVLLKPKIAQAGGFLPHSAIEFLYVDGHQKLNSLRSLQTYSKLRVLVIRNCTYPLSELRYLNEVPNLQNVYVEVLTKPWQQELQTAFDSRIRLLAKPVMSLGEIS